MPTVISDKLHHTAILSMNKSNRSIPDTRVSYQNRLKFYANCTPIVQVIGKNFRKYARFRREVYSKTTFPHFFFLLIKTLQNVMFFFFFRILKRE